MWVVDDTVSVKETPPYTRSMGQGDPQRESGVRTPHTGSRGCSGSGKGPHAETRGRGSQSRSGGSPGDRVAIQEGSPVWKRPPLWFIELTFFPSLDERFVPISQLRDITIFRLLF